MSIGSEPKTCPKCGAVIADEAPQGLCPMCLLRQASLPTEPGSKSPLPLPGPEELASLFPQLEILELIGKGGMGAVYKARQKELDRIVALKLLPPGYGNDPAFADRFVREARALAKLNHPAIVTLYEFGKAELPQTSVGAASQSSRPIYYFLMEFVDGVTLRQLLNAGRVSAREALAIVPQICDALQFAHDQGIVHRDIKPENILLDRRGHVKVADFGLAKIMESDRAEESGEVAPQTGATGVIGTPNYMAPEQVDHPSDVDHRADIYALGVVFYQMLTGELPDKQLQPPSSKVQIDVRLDEVVLRALEKKPELRYQQASLMKTQVETIALTPPSNRPSGKTRAKTAKYFWTICGILVVLLSVRFGFRIYSGLHQPVPFTAEFHRRIFEADAGLVDKWIPQNQRQSGFHTSDKKRLKSRRTIETNSQLAEINMDTLNGMLDTAAPKPVLLSEDRLMVSSVRGTFGRGDTWSWAGGTGNGLFGAWRKNGVLRANIEVLLSHFPDGNFGTNVSSDLLFEGDTPTNGVLAFFVPFRQDNNSKYLVVAFEVTDPYAADAAWRKQSRPIGHVVAICRPLHSPTQWWDAGKQPVPSDPTWLDKGQNAVLALLVEKYSDSLDVEIQTPGQSNLWNGGGLVSSSHIGDNRCICYYGETDGKFSHYLDQGGKLDVVMKAGVGQWQEIGSLKRGQTNLIDGGRFFVKDLREAIPGSDDFFGIGGRYGTAWLECQYDFDPAFEITFVAESKDGKRTPLPTSGFSSGKFLQRERAALQYLELDNRSIVRILVFKRPVTEQTISGLPLRSGNLPFLSATNSIPVAFTPVNQLTLGLGGSDGPTQWLDLDNGSVVEKPPGWFATQMTTSNRNSLPALGVAEIMKSDLTVTAIGMVVLGTVSNKYWEASSPADVVEEIERQVSEHLVNSHSPLSDMIMLVSSTSVLERTYVFKTPQRTIGLLQITGFSDNPRGVKIRYKLVQKDSSNAAVTSQLAWCSTDPYVAPDFYGFFPDDPEGGRKLDALWADASNKVHSDAEILQTVRAGLRRTQKFPLEILRWIGNRYIWGVKPQNPDAIEIMYHALASPDQTRDTPHWALYFGLSVVQPKPPAVLHTLADYCVSVNNPYDLERVMWGTKSQQAELLSFVNPYLKSANPAEREKAQIVTEIILGRTNAIEWGAAVARERAQRLFADQMPRIKEELANGDSATRRKDLEMIRKEALTSIMDDSFIGAYARCAEDAAADVRLNVTWQAGDRWVWSAKNQSVEVIDLMLKLSHDKDRRVRHDAVRYGLSTVRNKEEKVVRRLLEMALENSDPEVTQRVWWGLSQDKDITLRLLGEFQKSSDSKQAAAARQAYETMTGKTPGKPQ